MELELELKKGATKMKSYEIIYNRARKEFNVWAIESNGNTEIVKRATTKRSCELWLMRKGVSSWTDRT